MQEGTVEAALRQDGFDVEAHMATTFTAANTTTTVPARCRMYGDGLTEGVTSR